jgi:hypothetical protein
MRDVLIINGERYRKCPYEMTCLENMIKGEVVEIFQVQPLYEKGLSDYLGITFLMPQTKFMPGMKIRINVEG